MSKLRILHVIGGGEFGGAEQHILNLLSSFPPEEVEAGVVCFYNSAFAEQLRRAHIPVVTLERYGRFDLRLLQGLKETFRQIQPDIIHTHGVKANFFSRLAGREMGARMITTVHSHLRYDYPNPLVYLLVTLLERGTRHLNDHYITVSGAIGELLERQGVSAKRITLIYNGLPLAPFRRTEERARDRQRLRAEWQLEEDAFVFGAVARMVPVKGIHFLLEAFSRFMQQRDYPACRLVLVGDGPERNKLEELAERLELTPYVRFAGFRQDIPACLHAFDAFVHASLYEGLGYTIIEAMASELAVAVTEVGGVKEFVTAEKTGLLVPPGQIEPLAAAMERLADDHLLRQRLSQAALEMVEQTFSIEQMARQTLQLYHQLLERQNERAT